jgi:hypothetical protein
MNIPERPSAALWYATPTAIDAGFAHIAGRSGCGERSVAVVMPGAYVEVHLKLPESAPCAGSSCQCTVFRREGLQVGVVRDGKAQLVRVTPGHDYGDSMEILSGLQPTDNLILSPSDSLTSGSPVQVNDSQAKGAGE